MAALLVDEDMPRSLAVLLRAAGHDAVDVRDAGLRGAPDIDIFRYAQTHSYAIVTGDLGFGNELAYPPSSHCGVMVTRFPSDIPIQTLMQAIIDALQALSDATLKGSLVVIEPHRIRVRRRQQ